MPHAALLALALIAQPGAPAAARPGPSGLDLVTALETTVADAIARAEPSVVAVARVKGDSAETTAVRGSNPSPALDPDAVDEGLLNPLSDNYLALPGDYGSGVVIGERGEILTCYHLLRAAARIVVRAPGHRRFEAEIVAADPRSDLAVIVPRLPQVLDGLNLRPISIGRSERLRKGAFLTVLGNPYNAGGRDGRASAGWGILANTARRIEIPPEQKREVLPQFRNLPSLLQLDAKLNLGMSGGAVIDTRGELVGITTTGGNPEIYDAQAGYAIPMDTLYRRAVETLRQGKEVEYGFLGISIDPLISNRVSGVRPGTPADEGALLKDDLIIAVGDQPVGDDESLSLALSAIPAGAPVKLKVRRGGRTIDSTITMAKYPVQGPVIATVRPEAWRGVRVDFTSTLAGLTFTDEIARAYASGGVGVISVEAGSAADAAGLKRGQVITAVEGRRVRTPDEFREAVAGKTGPVRLTTQLGDEPDKPIVVK